MGFRERVAAKKAREAAREAERKAAYAARISGATGDYAGTVQFRMDAAQINTEENEAAAEAEMQSENKGQGNRAGSLGKEETDSLKDGVCRHCRICQWPACPFGR